MAYEAAELVEHPKLVELLEQVLQEMKAVLVKEGHSEFRLMYIKEKLNECMRMCHTCVSTFEDRRSSIEWMAGIILRELNVFEDAERERLAAAVTAGFVERENTREIATLKVKLVLLGLAQQCSAEIEDYDKFESNYNLKGWRIDDEKKRSAWRLKKNYHYLIHIVEPEHLAHIGFLKNLNPYNSEELLSEYKTLGRYIGLTIHAFARFFVRFSYACIGF